MRKQSILLLVAINFVTCLPLSANFEARAEMTSQASITFTDIQASLHGVYLGSASWGDFDNDGDLDIFLTGLDQAISVSKLYRNDGAGSFVDVSAPVTGVSRSAAAWGDCDNDGDLDLVLSGFTGSAKITRIYRNNGNGVFADSGVQLEGVDFSSVAWADYDNDGDLDLLLTGADSDGFSVVRLYRNDRNFGFVDTHVVGILGVAYGSIAWADYDNDSDLDLLLSGLSGLDNIPLMISKIYRNDGSGVFTDIGAALQPLSNGSASWGDYDNDGDSDVLLTGASPAINNLQSRIYRNDGGGIFTDINANTTGVANSSAHWGDLDNDGDLDILLTGDTYPPGTGLSLLYRNDGGGAFSSLGSLGLVPVRNSCATWGDFDNDLDLDILLTGNVGGIGTSRIYRNDGALPNSPPSTPGGAAGHIQGSMVTLSWDASADAQTASSGLSYNLRIGTTLGGEELAAAMADKATGLRKVVQPGNAWQRLSRSMPLTSPQLPWDRPLYWAVQAIDAGYSGSAFCAEQSMTIQPTILSVSDIPNDQGKLVRLRIERSPLDLPGQATWPISSYGVWRLLAEQSAGGAWNRAMSVGGFSLEVPRNLPSISAERLTLCGVEIRQGDGRTYARNSGLGGSLQNTPVFPPGTWELVAGFPATQQALYTVLAPTEADSGLAGPAPTSFLVSAHTSTPSVWFLSAVGAGQSRDNIPPGVPQALTADYRASSVNLSWNGSTEIDFDHFRIYRGTTSNFVPSPAARVMTTALTSWSDPVVGPQRNYYKLTAVDHGGNESSPATPSSISGVETEDLDPRAFALFANTPNPFLASTRIAFALPNVAHVELRVFEASGRLVRTIVNQMLVSGNHVVSWDGADERGREVAAGRYFYRLRAGSFEQTRAMLLLR